jgi:hypothetical protein
MSDDDMQGGVGLPAHVALMVEIVGLDDTMSLVTEFGGHRLSFSNGTCGHAYNSLQTATLIRLLGFSKAAELQRHFAGKSLEVPRCMLALKRLRNQRIRMEAQAGQAKIDIALKYRLTERQLWNILNAV